VTLWLDFPLAVGGDRINAALPFCILRLFGDPIVGDPIVGDPIVGDPIVGDNTSVDKSFKNNEASKESVGGGGGGGTAST
jgi:hypothetical protein